MTLDPCQSERDRLPPEVISRLQGVYDVGEWLEWSRTPKGSSNVSFFLTASTGRYVLRRSNSRKTVEGIRFEIDLLRFLREKSYPAPELAPTADGTGFTEIDGTLYLMTRLLKGTEYEPENLHHLGEAGRGLGLYHRLVRDYPDPPFQRETPNLERLAEEGIARVDEFLSLAGRFLSQEKASHLNRAAAEVRDQFTRIQADVDRVLEDSTRQIIQGSFGRSALLYDGDRLAGVVDYDRATLEARGVDLSYTLKAFCRVQDRSDPAFRVGLDFARTQCLLEAYQREDRLPEAEIRALPTFMEAQRLMKVSNKCGNFLRKNETIPQEEKDVHKLATVIEREEERIRWLEEHTPGLLEAVSS